MMSTNLRFDSRIQFLRHATVDDGFGEVDTYSPVGEAIWAARMDVSDAERLRAGEVSATITRRFTVQSGELTRSITPRDRLVYDGVAYGIFGVKAIGTRFRLEITAGARIDQ